MNRSVRTPLTGGLEAWRAGKLSEFSGQLSAYGWTALLQKLNADL
jgi:hypothetical protein